MWKPINQYYIPCIGILNDKTPDENQSIPKDDSLEDITDIILGDDRIVQNGKGELALFANGTYYPIQWGHWVQDEPVTLVNDDGTLEEEIEKCDFNALIEYNGRKYLLLLTQSHPIPLRFSANPAVFYQEDGTLPEEPEESLEKLEENYRKACEEYKQWREEYNKVLEPYRNPETGEIDYDAIENDDSPEGIRAFQYGLADFNCFGAFDEYQYLIDLKIMHINARNTSDKTTSKTQQI